MACTGGHNNRAGSVTDRSVSHAKTRSQSRACEWTDGLQVMGLTAHIFLCAMGLRRITYRPGSPRAQSGVKLPLRKFKSVFRAQSFHVILLFLGSKCSTRELRDLMQYIALEIGFQYHFKCFFFVFISYFWKIKCVPPLVHSKIPLL